MSRALAGIALVCLPLTAGAQNPDPTRFGWHTDYATARAEARRTGQPIMLVFRCQP